MLTVLIVGYGSVGKRHINNLLTFSEIRIILLTNRKKIDQTDFKNFSASTICDRIEIINSIDRCLLKKPDIAIISNETSYHIKIATKIASQGIDLFIEKPLSNSLRNVKNLVNIAREKKLVTMVGCNFRFYPPFKRIKELLDAKKIGRILSVRIENGSYLPDWHSCENYQNSYAARQDLGGGVTLTQIHELDYLYWFFGLPHEVFSIIGKFSNLKISADDLCCSIMKYPTFIAEIHLDYFQRPYFKSCKIKGTKGVISWNSETNQVRIFDSTKKRWKTSFISKNYSLNSSAVNNMYMEEMTYFLQCVKKRKSSINEIGQAKELLELVISMKKSSNLKKMIKI